MAEARHADFWRVRYCILAPQRLERGENILKCSHLVLSPEVSEALWHLLQALREVGKPAARYGTAACTQRCTAGVPTPSAEGRVVTGPQAHSPQPGSSNAPTTPQSRRCGPGTSP